MQKITFEVCAGSYQDCLAAEKGGADRVELNSALSVGGLTPSLISLMRAKKETSLKIVCMVRPRAGGFCYDETEAQLMLEEAELLLEHGADGIAFGFLKADRTVDAEKTKKMVELIHVKGDTDRLRCGSVAYQWAAGKSVGGRNIARRASE